MTSNKLVIEVASPFATEEFGGVVKTILISVLEPDLNVIQVPPRDAFALMT